MRLQVPKHTNLLFSEGCIFLSQETKKKHYMIINKDAPLIDHSLKVRLPNGTINSVNVFDFNLAYAVHSFDPEKWVTVQLDDGSWIQVGSLQPLYEED